MKTIRVSRILAAGSLLLAVQAYAGVGHWTGDTYVNSANPTQNFGDAAVLKVGGTNTALVQFDLTDNAVAVDWSPNLPSNVPR